MNKEKIREVEALRVYCVHKRKGCGWTGELGDIHQHLTNHKGCGYAWVQCTNKQPRFQCNKEMERRHLAKHLESECNLRQYPCEHCGYQDTYDAIAGAGTTYVPHPSSIVSSCPLVIDNHYDDCANYPMECPNECGDVKIKRRHMVAHRDSCRLEPLNCPFKYISCTGKIAREDMADHRQKNMEEHLLLLAKSHEELARKNEQLSRKVEELITDSYTKY